MDITIDGRVGKVAEISEFATWSDERVLSQCLMFGEQARRWRQRFLGILPEVYKRKLHERHGYGSIFEFAFRTGGVSKEQVQRVLHVEEELRDKPKLHALLVSGQVSIYKLAKVHTVATRENQELLANQVQLLSARGVETLARDIRQAKEPVNFRHVPEIIPQNNLQLSEEVQGRLLELQHKGIDVNQLLTELLNQREEQIEQEKEKIAATCEPTISHYIPKKIRDIVEKEHGTKCSIRGCNKPYNIIHHTQRHAISQTHDPRYLAPLCTQHHEIAHAIDVKVQERKRR